MEIICKKCNSKNVYALDAWDRVKIIDDKTIIIDRTYGCDDCHRRSAYRLKGSFSIDSAELIALPAYTGR